MGDSVAQSEIRSVQGSAYLFAPPRSCGYLLVLERDIRPSSLPMRASLSKILDMNFGENLFHALG